MKISIVILNWNGAGMLRRFLPSVLECSEGADVIVADNGSEDDSLQVLAHDFPQVRTIVMNHNYGFAEGYNVALRQVDSDIYVLLNSDVRVTPGWLDPLVGFLEAHPQVAAVQPKIRCEWSPQDFEYAGASGGFIDSLGYPYCRGRLMGTVETDGGQYDEPIPVFWATGAALVIRSADYWSAGGLDGRFFAHQEEIDLCWRLRSRGRVCAPERGLSSGRRYVASGKSAQDVPQFPQQSASALQESARTQVAHSPAYTFLAGCPGLAADVAYGTVGQCKGSVAGTS